uniref:Uncharacterized protein n=1 Tax=Chromera velia CCMP2878 TaxID=1169474 RepID=A0A0G4HAN9_9ALVE|eukprot:Cvel_25715.t1-p1 / transcript=Cvel_25715.t1 / gene=Cvel_25715 / organism=Chromera_velia_CCMP2878 / gene_product=hypothetical protein / transcript_product=hypothetical protein / location=Cvel_scaffold2953:12670-17443(+) / protein_length=177 / sequence_SO=supercontig / SO=protein_coding / is_pseudo=false
MAQDLWCGWLLCLQVRQLWLEMVLVVFESLLSNFKLSRTLRCCSRAPVFFFLVLQGSASPGEGWKKSGACSNASFSFHVEQGHPGSMPLRVLLSLGPANRGPLSAPPALIQALFLLQVASPQKGVLGVDPQSQKPVAGRLRCLFFQELSVLIYSVQALILPLPVLDFFWCTAWNYTQ